MREKWEKWERNEYENERLKMMRIMTMIVWKWYDNDSMIRVILVYRMMRKKGI